MVLDPLTVDILVCPETKAALAVASPAQLAQINAALAQGAVLNRAGRRVTGPLQAALVRQDGQVAYPVRDGLPLLLIDEQLELRGVL